VSVPDDRRAIEPDAGQIEALMTAAADDTPVVMLNLLRYRERAAYPRMGVAGVGVDAHEQ
jgi:hypothetical protein